MLSFYKILKGNRRIRLEVKFGYNKLMYSIRIELLNMPVKAESLDVSSYLKGRIKLRKEIFNYENLSLEIIYNSPYRIV